VFGMYPATSTCVQVSPRVSETAIEQLADAAAETQQATCATSSEPGGGVKLAVAIVLAAVVLTTAGLAALSARDPGAAVVPGEPSTSISRRA